MSALLTSLIHQLDWRLTLLAAAVCVVGMGACMALVGMARRAGGRRRLILALCAGLVGGLSIWATHLLVIRGYQTAELVRYSGVETVALLAVAICGQSTAAVAALSPRSRFSRLMIAVMASSSVVVMHYMGMAALHVDGGLVSWNATGVAVSIALAVAVSLTTALGKREGWWRMPLNTGVAVLAIFTLHFGSIASMSIVLDPSVSLPASGFSETILPVWATVGAAMLVLIAGLATAVSLWGGSNALRQLREAIDTMPDGLGLYDADDRLVVWNARFAEVNAEVSEAVNAGVRFRDLLQIGIDKGLYVEALGREAEWIEERLAARRRLSNAMELQIAGDRWLRVQDRRTAQGGIVTVVNDITDLKRDAKALAEARDAAEAANRAKSEFLSNMSHEIRTPLNGVIGLTQALARTPLSHQQSEILELVHASSQTLQTLLNDILDLARVESGRLEIADEPYNLGKAVRESGQLYAAPAVDKGLQFFVEVDPTAEIWVRGDVVRIKQVLTNLVSNAVKFTTKGFVSLTATAARSADGRSILRFTVEDTGVGFDAGAKARLFTRFEQADGTITRRFGGTGLGLAICRQLADMMGGELDCESEPGGGSAFILTLPLIAAEAPEAAPVAVAPTDETSSARVRVLIADDHPTNRKVVELILAAAPVDLVSVEDGAQALTAARSEAFDLILMDMQMPVMDGLTAVKEIRLHEAAMGLERTPIVMLTANALPDHIAAGQAAGADRHLAKPFNAAELLSLVEELGGEGRALAA